MSGLFSLVYASAATHLLSGAEIGHLVERAQRRNARENVTGLLLYNGGNFMHCLEGPEPALSGILKIIEADSVHCGMVELFRTPIAEREFGQWPLAFLDIDGPAGSSVKDGEALIRTKLLSAAEPRKSNSRMLMATFYRNSLDRP